MNKILLAFFVLLINISVFSSNSQRVDSLKNVVDTIQNDTLKIAAILAWDEEIYLQHPDSSILLNSLVIEIANNNLQVNNQLHPKAVYALKKQKASALNNLGSTYNQIGNIDKALESHKESLKIKKEIGYKRGIAYSYNNLGFIYSAQANIPKALVCYHKSLKIRTELNDTIGMSGSLNNIGIIYYHQKNIEQALDYFLRSVELLKDIKKNRRIAYTLINIGHIYSKQGKYTEALAYFNKSLEILNKAGNYSGVADIYLNVGGVYYKQNNFSEAISYFEESIKLYEKIERKQGLSRAYSSLANAYLKQKNYSKSITYAQKALEYAQKADLAIETRDAAQILYKNYENIDASKEALEMYQLFIKERDSVLSNENQKESIRQKFKYEYEKQAATDSIQAAEARKVTDAQIAAQKAQISKEKTQRFALYGGVFFLIVFGVFMYNRFRITRKQKTIIENQKTEVEEKNKEILDSINYAKRIQSAILPPPQLVKEYLSESFILYKPKDIVAGDFYWMEQKDDMVLFAAADCTGHGVPGAMVSVVCNNGLNRSVREHGLTHPGEILDKTREIVVQEFEKSNEDVQDGMDIALCTLNGNSLEYAGAHNPLWIIRNKEVLITKANKQPIGKFDNPKPYLNHKINLEKGDTIYIFSDGYVDQFGGEKGKKLKAKAFKEMLLSIQDLSMLEQKKYLDDAFEKWKGHLDQIDDVCLIGVRIS